MSRTADHAQAFASFSLNAFILSRPNHFVEGPHDIRMAAHSRTEEDPYKENFFSSLAELLCGES